MAAGEWLPRELITSAHAHVRAITPAKQAVSLEMAPVHPAELRELF
jgi:hypothetical protein